MRFFALKRVIFFFILVGVFYSAYIYQKESYEYHRPVLSLKQD